MNRLTVRGLAQGFKAYPCGDITYISAGIYALKAGKFSTFNPESIELFDGVPEHICGVMDSPKIALIKVQNAYELHRMAHKGREPFWTRNVSNNLKRLLRHSWITGEGSDPFAIVFSNPYSGVGYVVREDGITQQTVETFNLSRLHWIRQLAFLDDPKAHGEDLSNVAVRFEHSRYLHVLNVAAIANLIARNNELSVSDRRHLRVAALTHDALTPAGGDTTKIVDPQGFNEDFHYFELFDRFDCASFMKRFGLSKEKLVQTVLGKGVLGGILDIADKIAYVTDDTMNYLDAQRVIFDPKRVSFMRKFAHKHPFVCGVWDSVRVEHSEVFVEDKKRLADFLTLRATLFAELYQNPRARFFEHTIAGVVIKYLYEEQKALTREMLLRMTDHELDDVVYAVTGSHYSCGIDGVERAKVMTFDTIEEARQFELALYRKTPSHVALVENFVSATSTGSKIKVAPGVTFESACPKETETLRRIMGKNRPVRVYHFPISEGFKPEFKEALLAYQARRRESLKS